MTAWRALWLALLWIKAGWGYRLQLTGTPVSNRCYRDVVLTTFGPAEVMTVLPSSPFAIAPSLAAPVAAVVSGGVDRLGFLGPIEYSMVSATACDRPFSGLVHFQQGAC